MGCFPNRLDFQAPGLQVWPRCPRRTCGGLCCCMGWCPVGLQCQSVLLTGASRLKAAELRLLQRLDGEFRFGILGFRWVENC